MADVSPAAQASTGDRIGLSVVIFNAEGTNILGMKQVIIAGVPSPGDHVTFDVQSYEGGQEYLVKKVLWKVIDRDKLKEGQRPIWPEVQVTAVD
jgi:hypothetical protein